MRTDPVRQFEDAFAAHQGAVAARAFWNGRAGLFGVLRALGVTSGSRVGVCAYTCVSVVEAVTRLRAVPVFLDVDAHMNIAPAALNGLTTPLHALILQHTFGVPCDLDASMAWARARSVPVIEDCCHALDAVWEGRRVGCIGLAGIFSFEWGKPFTTGQGGMATFTDAQLAREVDRVIAAEGVHPGRRAAAGLAVQRQLYRCLVTPDTLRLARGVYRWACRRGWLSSWEPRSPSLIGGSEGFLRLASAGQGRAGLRQFRRWPDTMRRRCAAAAAIHRKLRDAGIPFVEPDPRAVPMYLRCPIRVRSKPKLLDAAEKLGLDIAGWYLSPAHPLQGEALHTLGYTPGACPAAEEAFAHVVTLPTLPALRGDRLDAAVRIIQEAL